MIYFIDRTASAGFSPFGGRQWAGRRPSGATAIRALHVMAVSDHVNSKIEEHATWSISAPQSGDQAKAVPTAFSSLLSLSWAWLDMRLSKTRSGLRSVTVPLRPNRNWHKPQTDITSFTTHVTLSQRGGRYFAPALFWFQRCTCCARIVHANHTLNSKVSPC
jgi:hypothetical protein